MRALCAGTVAAALLLAGCASSDAAPAPEPTDRITYEILSWGYVLERWTISATGEATLEKPPEGAQLGAQTSTRAFALTTADFERVREALAPAEALLADGVPCERLITDAPYGAVKWRRPDGSEDAIRYDNGCAPNPRLETLFERIDAASAIFHAAIGAD